MSEIFVRVYLMPTGEIIKIPDEVADDAIEINSGKSIHDRRTRGSKIIENWASQWMKNNYGAQISE